MDMFEKQRRLSRIWIARAIDARNLCVEALAPLEPNVPWEEPFLTYRYGCYQAHRHPLAARARRDLETFLDAAPPKLAEGLVPVGPHHPGPLLPSPPALPHREKRETNKTPS